MKEITYPFINLANVKGVLIDLDNTIYDFETPHQKAILASYHFFKKIISFEEFKEKYSFILHENIKGGLPCQHSRYHIFRQIAEEKNLPYPWLMAEKVNLAFWNVFIKNMKVDKNALAFLKETKKKNIPVCLVTDLLASIQTRKLKRLGIAFYIDFMVSNDEVYCDKPDKRMFEAALKKLHLSAQDVIMIGDNPKRDILGADRMGIKSYLVTFKEGKNKFL
ncbi:MAG: HAD family hydrolase [Alphaproteobacteria bacterium]|nr:HAD family hydrolase [Alphaproteobacteria bacterium]